jgi:hypothetical protein
MLNTENLSLKVALTNAPIVQPIPKIISIYPTFRLVLISSGIILVIYELIKPATNP